MATIHNIEPNPKGNPLAAQTHIKLQSGVRTGGQRKHELRIGAQPNYVDGDRKYLNRTLVEPLTGAELRKICETRRSQRQTKRAMKSSASINASAVISFGVEAQKLFKRLSVEQQDAAYLELANRVAEKLNTTVTGLVVHEDESAPHGHVQMPAFDLDGNPVSETAKRGAMRVLQDITHEVMAKHCEGIERGNSKKARLEAGAKYSDVINWSVSQLHDELPRQLASLMAKVKATEEKLSKNEKRLAGASKKLKAVEADNKAATEKLEKAKKLETTYAKRVENQRKALADLVAEWERLTALVDQKKATLVELSRTERAIKAEQKRAADLNKQNEQIESQLAQKKTNIATLATKKQTLLDRSRALRIA